MRTTHALAALARAGDAVLAALAGPLLDHAAGARRAAAMADPVYAHRARTRGGERTLDDWIADSEIEDALGPHPWWEPAARALAGRPVTGAVMAVRHAGQRVARGWDDTATWSLDRHLAATLGAQLLHLADTAHGWPGDEEFPTFEDWAAALRRNGDALLAYADPGPDGMGWQGEPDGGAATIAAAADALRWVADHLPSLWD